MGPRLVRAVYWEEESIHSSNTLANTVLPIPGTSGREMSVMPALSFSHRKPISST